MTHLTNQWYQEVRAAPSDTEEELETPLWQSADGRASARS
jgi:hypothetical protein